MSQKNAAVLCDGPSLAIKKKKKRNSIFFFQEKKTVNKNMKSKMYIGPLLSNGQPGLNFH